MAGVISCRTNYTQNTKQCICNLEVTEALASLFETNGMILSGPVGHLTFKLRSGDDNGPTEELMLVDDTGLPEPKTKIIPTRADALLDDLSASGSEASVDGDLLNSSDNTLTPPSPWGSETDSLTNSLGNKFKLLGFSKEDWPPLDDSSSR